MRQLTEEQKAKTAERKERFRKLCKQVAEMTPEQREEFSKKMPVIANIEGKPYSLHNTILIYLQGGTSCTIVGGFKQWLSAGRVVKKGEHGFSIWFPRNRKKEESPSKDELNAVEKEDLSFLIGTVFDISQTAEINISKEIAA